MLFALSIVFLLLLLNGFFAMAEMAIVSSRRARLRRMVDEKRKGARRALILARDPSSFLSVVQVGVTLVGVFAGAFSGAALAQPLGAFLDRFSFIAPHGQQIAFIATVSAVSFLSLVIGELAPKRVGLAYAESIAVRVAPFMCAMAVALGPFVWILKASTNALLKFMRLDSARAVGVTQEEIRDLVAEGARAGVSRPAEKDMIEGALRLSDRNVRGAMTPRIDIAWLGVEEGDALNRQAILESKYSRLPLARGDMEDVLGIIHKKDVLRAVLNGETVDLAALAQKALVVPDTTSLLRLLDRFKQTDQHLAIVIDEYGSVEGLVTLTDVLEAIIGDLPSDGGGQDAEDKPFRREDGSWLFDGMTSLDTVEAAVGLKGLRGNGEYCTIAGFILDQLGRLPVAGDKFVWQSTPFEVVDMDGRRIDKILIGPTDNGR